MNWGIFLVTFLFQTVYGSINSWTTSCNKSDASILTLLDPLNIFDTSENFDSQFSFQLDFSIKKQTMWGFGAGLPQASAIVLSNLKSTSHEVYWSLMDRLFGRGGDDARISVLRFPIGACDFSRNMTTFDEFPNDYSLVHFHPDPDSYLMVEILRDALSINPEIGLIASPWSPPSWLKVQDTLIPYSNNNTLLPTDQAFETYANYLIKVLEFFQKENDLPISFLTLQNEPLFGDSDQYPGMYLSSSDSVKIAKILRGKLNVDKIFSGVGILSYDHNWDQYQYPIDAIYGSGPAGSLFSGVAWHCYGGSMSTAQETFNTQFPFGSSLYYPQHVTECTGSFPDNTCNISQGLTGFGWNHEWDMSNIFLAATSHWAVSGTKWILALDENCGPTLPLVTYRNGRPLVSIPSQGISSMKDFEKLKFNQDYWTISHMSRYIPKGSHRIQTSILPASPSSLISETFLDPLTGLASLLVMNTDHNNPALISVSISDSSLVSAISLPFNATIPPFSTSIFRFPVDVNVIPDPTPSSTSSTTSNRLSSGETVLLILTILLGVSCLYLLYTQYKFRRKQSSKSDLTEPEMTQSLLH